MIRSLHLENGQSKNFGQPVQIYWVHAVGSGTTETATASGGIVFDNLTEELLGNVKAAVNIENQLRYLISFDRVIKYPDLTTSRVKLRHWKFSTIRVQIVYEPLSEKESRRCCCCCENTG